METKWYSEKNEEIMKGRSRKLVWSEISTYLEHDSTDFTMFIWIKSGTTLFQNRIGQEEHLPCTLLWHKCYETESQNTMMLYLMHKLCQCHYEKTLFTVQVCVLFTFVAMACCSKPVQPPYPELSSPQILPLFIALCVSSCEKGGETT